MHSDLTDVAVIQDVSGRNGAVGKQTISGIGDGQKKALYSESKRAPARFDQDPLAFYSGDLCRSQTVGRATTAALNAPARSKDLPTAPFIHVGTASIRALGGGSDVASIATAQPLSTVRTAKPAKGIT
jgi:hypothetical protein